MALLQQPPWRLLAGLILLCSIVPSATGAVPGLPAVSVTRVATTIGEASFVEASNSQQLATVKTQYSVYRVKNNSRWPVNLELKIARKEIDSGIQHLHVYLDGNDNGWPDPDESVVTGVSLDSGEARSLLLRKPAELLIIVVPE